MLLYNQISSYVTKSQATNMISLIVILMCHTECIAIRLDLLFVLYLFPFNVGILSLRKLYVFANLSGREDFLSKRFKSASASYATPCLAAHANRLQMFPNRTQASGFHIVLVA